MYNVNTLPALLDIGITGANRQTEIRIDVSAWQERYPDAVFAVCVRRPGEDEDHAYFGDTAVAGGILYWMIHRADLGTASGTGRFEVWALQPGHEADDEPLFKSASVMTRIRQSVAASASSELPEAARPWAQQVLDAKEAAMGAAAQAAESVEHYPQIGENGNWYVWDAETEAFVDTEYPARGAQGEQGAAGPQGEIGPQGPQGIQGLHGIQGPQGPAGPQGPQGIQGNPGSDGQDGQDGQDGVSPAITVTEITGGHTVKITDAAHPDGQTFQVMDGEDGDDAPQIDDTQASPTNPYSGYHISQLLSDKADLTQVVRYDATQTLTDDQKKQARQNAGAKAQLGEWKSVTYVTTASETGTLLFQFSKPFVEANVITYCPTKAGGDDTNVDFCLVDEDGTIIKANVGGLANTEMRLNLQKIWNTAGYRWQGTHMNTNDGYITITSHAATGNATNYSSLYSNVTVNASDDLSGKLPYGIKMICTTPGDCFS